MKEFFEIGKILKPRGIKGEVKILPLSGEAKSIINVKGGYVDGVYFAIEKAYASDGVYVKFRDVNDRTAAELLRGKTLTVRREDAAPLSRGEYYIADLIGLPVYTENEKIGMLTGITSAKTDIFTVKTENNVLRFPFLKDLVVKIDVEGGKIILKESRLKEVGVYEI